MGKEIRIIKKNGSKISDGYTFIDDRLVDLRMIASNQNDSNVSSSSDDKKCKEYAFKLRNNPKKKDMKGVRRSRFAGGYDTQSHSPVYE
ncbi:MAG TPA: hypothetical protein VFZ67_00500 [Nitrososphaera sp.]